MTLVLERLTVSLHQRRLAALDTSIAPGEILCVMGPSGSGKSSLLNALLGILPKGFDVTGRVWLSGRDITALAVQDRHLGILFQDPLLFPHMSVGENLAFALPRRTIDRAGQIASALSGMGLSGFADRDPASLSGGQQARAALIRTLLAQPRALLLDEPFSRLDRDLRGQIRGLVFDHARTLGLPVVLVTHDAEDARAAGGRVIDTFGRPVPL